MTAMDDTAMVDCMPAVAQHLHAPMRDGALARAPAVAAALPDVGFITEVWQDLSRFAQERLWKCYHDRPSDQPPAVALASAAPVPPPPPLSPPSFAEKRPEHERLGRVFLGQSTMRHRRVAFYFVGGHPVVVEALVVILACRLLTRVLRY